MMKRKFIYISCLFLGMWLGGCSSLEDYNRAMYKTNKVVDKYTLKPVAKAYRLITPDPVEKGVNNFFDNLSEVGTVVNSILQGKFRNAALSSSRIVWNTTLGLGGIFDVATAMNVKANPEDFGQTLQVWGVPTGPYIVLPILGPSTITDSVGLVGDYFTYPLTYYNDWSDHSVREGVAVLRFTDMRAKLLPLEKKLEDMPDEYSFVKSAYLQHRASLVRDGAIQESNDIDAEFDALLDEEDEEGE